MGIGIKHQVIEVKDTRTKGVITAISLVTQGRIVTSCMDILMTGETRRKTTTTQGEQQINHFIVVKAELEDMGNQPLVTITISYQLTVSLDLRHKIHA